MSGTLCLPANAHRKPQKINFKQSCRMRGSPADVILPKPGGPNVVPGFPKLTLLNTLKNSARNCTFTRSVMLVSLISPRSVSKKRGPRRMFLPELPKVPVTFGPNREVLKNFWISCACERPLSMVWLKLVPVKSARSLPTPLKELSTPLKTENGNPLCQVVIDVNSQPFRTRGSGPCNFGPGIAQTAVKRKRCGMSS